MPSQQPLGPHPPVPPVPGLWLLGLRVRRPGHCVSPHCCPDPSPSHSFRPSCLFLPVELGSSLSSGSCPRPGLSPRLATWTCACPWPSGPALPTLRPRVLGSPCHRVGDFSVQFPVELRAPGTVAAAWPPPAEQRVAGCLWSSVACTAASQRGLLPPPPGLCSLRCVGQAGVTQPHFDVQRLS